MSPYGIATEHFDLAQTLDCGQAFRWQQNAAGQWEGCAGSRFLRLRQEAGLLWPECTGEEFAGFWRGYFDLDADYGAMLEGLSALHPVLAEAARLYPGIRILRQEPWEALCSFLLSQNNNIPRIKGLLGRFCRLCGTPVSGTDCFAFPTVSALLSLTEEDLAPLRAGYRAKYLLDAARKVAGGEVDLQKIARSPAEFGRSELQKIVGVGPKVAECVLLYGFHKTECFPIDVWMKRAMAVLLPGFGPADFGEAAGLAQQLIFHYSRMHPALFQ